MIWLIIYLVGCLFSFMCAIYLVRDSGKLVVGDIVPLLILLICSWLTVIVMGIYFFMYSNISKVVIWKKK